MKESWKLYEDFVKKNQKEIEQKVISISEKFNLSKILKNK